MCPYFIGLDSSYRDADGSIEYMRLLHVIRMDVTFDTRATNASGEHMKSSLRDSQGSEIPADFAPFI